MRRQTIATCIFFVLVLLAASVGCTEYAPSAPPPLPTPSDVPIPTATPTLPEPVHTAPESGTGGGNVYQYR